MITLHKQGRIHPIAYQYCLANCTVLSFCKIQSLHPYKQNTTKYNDNFDDINKPLNFASQWLLIYSDIAWLGNAYRHLHCYEMSNGYWIVIDEIGTFYVKFEPQKNTIIGIVDSIQDTHLEEVLLGPLLTLAFFHHRLICLHASSILVDNKVFAFLGDSGQGKSTLATYLNQCGYTRISDDILVISYADTFQVMPSFPQLKLEQQCIFKTPLTLHYLIHLTHQEDKNKPTLQTLSAQKSMLKIIQHTVAARLFNRKMLKRHLSVCTQMALTYPMAELKFKQDHTQLPAIKQLLDILI